MPIPTKNRKNIRNNHPGTRALGPGVKTITPVASEIDLAARARVYPKLMLRALWWFRWSAFVTVIVGLIYWGDMVAGDAAGAHATSGAAMGSFFGIWTAVWAILYALLIPPFGSRGDTSNPSQRGRCGPPRSTACVDGATMRAPAGVRWPS